jgi:hypothetical protein
VRDLRRRQPRERVTSPLYPNRNRRVDQQLGV